jgi:hypothetical protein
MTYLLDSVPVTLRYGVTYAANISRRPPDKIGFSEPNVTSWAMKQFVEACETYNQKR